MGHPDLACNFGWDHALLEQISGLHPPRLQLRKVAAWPKVVVIHRPARLTLYRNIEHL
jgi:hypothetical protein